MAAEINAQAASGTRRLAVGRNTLILLVSNFASAAFGLLVSVLIARGAGDAVLGSYSLALAWSLTLAQFADLGMSTLLTRDLARDPNLTASYLWASLISKTVLGLVLVGGLVAAAPALVPGEMGLRALQLGSTLILVNAWYGSFTAIFRAFGRMMPILLLNAGGLALQAGLTWGLVRAGAGAEGLIGLAVGIQLLQVIGAGSIYWSRLPNARARPNLDWQYILRLIRAGIPFAIAGILAGVELRANVLMLGALQGERAVGWYSAASRLYEGIRLAPNAFFGAVLPALAALGSAHDRTQLRQFFRRRAWALIGFGCAMALVLSAIAPWLISFLYGEAFAPAVPVLVVLGWGLIPALVTGLLILYLYAQGDEHYVNRLIGVGLVVQVGAAFALMRTFGAAGAAAATLLSDCILWALLQRRITQLEKETPANGRIRITAFLSPLALVGVALGVRILPILRSSFDGLYGQDAYAYFGYARTLFDSLTHLQAPPPFWWSLGYPALLNAAFVFGGVNIATAQAVTVLCGALVAPCAYALARELAPQAYRETAGWVAGLVCAWSGQLVQSSIVIMADAPALLFATLGAWLLVRYARTQVLVTLSLAALAVGMAVWVRWQNLIFAAVWCIALVVVEFAPRPALIDSAPVTLRRKLGTVLLAFALAGLVLLPQLFIQTATRAPLAGQSWLEGWSPLHFFAYTFDTVDGHFEYALPVALFYGQVFVHPAYLVALLTPLCALGFVALLRESGAPRQKAGPLHHLDRSPFALRDGRNAGALVLLGGWIVVMYLFLAGIPYENFRFGLGLFPPIAVLTGIGAGWAWHALGTSRLRFAFVGFIVLAFALMLYWQPRVYTPVLEIKARELDQVQWVSTQLAPDARLWTMSVDGAFGTYSALHITNLWDHSADTIRASAPAFLFVDTHNLETQWRDTAPGNTFQTLQAAGLLTPLGMRGGFTLFRIKP